MKLWLDSSELIPVLQPHWYPVSGMYVYFRQHSQKAKRVRVLVDFLRDVVAINS